jgi:beta-lactamase regulating signal transducer with metallopeptidase domain
MNVFAAQEGTWWLTIALSVACRAAVLLVGAGVIVLALRRSPAATRHLVWSVALGGTLLLPVLTLTLPSWSWPILPSVARASVPPANEAGLAATAAIDGTGGLNHSDELAGDDLLPDHGGGGSTISPMVARAPASASVSKPAPWRAWPWALCLWAAGATLVLTGPLLGRIGLRLALRGAASVELGEWAELSRQASQKLGLRRRVRIVRGAGALMPVTCGWLRPVVILPATAEEWSRERCWHVLLHELAHVRRLDYLTQSIAQAACAVYWFNPLAWFAAHRMRIERERACDDIVLLHSSSASDYALHLLEIARGLRGSRIAAWTAVAMAQPSLLEARLRAILDPDRRRGGKSRRSAVFLSVALAGLLLPLASIRLGARAAEMIQTPERPTAGAAQAGAIPGPRMTVRGVVVDSQGKPVPDASVTILSWRKHSERLMLYRFGSRLVIDNARCDQSGRFRSDVLRTSSSTHDRLAIAALGSGHGIGWVEIDPDAEAPNARITIEPELVIEGRLFDVQARPARDVRVSIPSVLRTASDGISLQWQPTSALAGWPGSVTTDAEGRLTLRGLSRDLVAELAIDDPRFANQHVSIDTGSGTDARQAISRVPRVKVDTSSGTGKLTLALQPAQVVTGRVTLADNGKPVAHAPIEVQSSSDGSNASAMSEFEADAQGRFRINPPRGDHFLLRTQSPSGAPYLIASKRIDWPRGAVEQSIDLAVERGIVISGRVTEQRSGLPIAGAIVRFNPYPDRSAPTWPETGVPAVTGSDGHFTITARPGPGYVVVTGPTDDYVFREFRGDGVVVYARPGTVLQVAHGYTFLDVKPSTTGHEVSLTIERGATVEGRVTNSDGRPARDVVMVSRLTIASHFGGGWSIPPGIPPRARHVRDGRFVLSGIGPDAEVPVYFLDPEHDTGAMLNVSAKSPGAETKIVTLERCGSARARLVGPDGKPVAGQRAGLLIVPAGLSTDARAWGGGWASPDVINPAEFRERPVSRPALPRSDAQGWIEYAGLIPGASYRLSDTSTTPLLSRSEFRREFTVKPGETLVLGDILVAKPPVAR